MSGRKEKIQEFVVRDSGHRQWRMVNAGIGKHLQVKKKYSMQKRILCSTKTQQNETFLPEL